MPTLNGKQEHGSYGDEFKASTLQLIAGGRSVKNLKNQSLLS
jgi:hypothetical protein